MQVRKRGLSHLAKMLKMNSSAHQSPRLTRKHIKNLDLVSKPYSDTVILCIVQRSLTAEIVLALLNYLMGILDVSHSHRRRNILGVMCYKSRTPACQCTDPFPYISSEFLLLISTSIGPTRILFSLVPSDADLVLGFLLMLYQLCC